MTINPRNYDLGELRGDVDAPDAPDTSTASETADTSTASETAEQPRSPPEDAVTTPRTVENRDRRTAKERHIAERRHTVEGPATAADPRPDRGRATGGVRMEFPAPPSTSASEGEPGRDSLDELRYLQNAIDDVERPFLTELPAGQYAERLILEWLEYMVLKAGREKTREGLEYYESIEWIDERARDDLEAYTNTFSEGNPGGELTVDDHRVSLVYIARLSGLQTNC